jgi:hypothetical protein
MESISPGWAIIKRLIIILILKSIELNYKTLIINIFKPIFLGFSFFLVNVQICNKYAADKAIN